MDNALKPDSNENHNSTQIHTYPSWQWRFVWCILLLSILLCCVAAFKNMDVGDHQPADQSLRIKATLQRANDGKLMLHVENNPWGVVGLSSHSDSLELPLQRGNWLVIVYSPHNFKHVELALGASEIAQSLAGKCRLAIRPSVGFGDLESWVADKDIAEQPLAIGVPLWLLYHDGELIGKTGGQLPPSSVVDFALTILEDSAK